VPSFIVFPSLSLTIKLALASLEFPLIDILSALLSALSRVSSSFISSRVSSEIWTVGGVVSSKLISDTFLLSCPLLPALSVAVIVISSPLAKPSLNIAVLLPSKLSIIY